MANPTVSANLNKSTFNVGETMTLTVVYGDTDSTSGTVTITVTDPEGNSSAPVTVPYTITDTPLVVTVSDPTRTFVKQSDTGSTAIYTSVA